MIQLRELTKRYGPVLAVDRLDLDIDQRGVVGFLGPNGAGKTTTMRILTGFLPQTSGTAVVCGHDVFEAPLEVKARVGYLPETPPLYPELNVGEYLGFVAEIRGVPRERRLARVGDAMERVGLRGWERRLLGGLSRGYRQRVGIAQALLHDPPLLILDEPTAGLDPAQLVPIRALIHALGEDHLVLLSTHILAEVDALCSRVVLIDRGRVVGDGTVSALAADAGVVPWLELALADVDEDVSAAIAALPEVETVRRLDRARYRVVGTGAAAGALAALVARNGWTLVGISPREASLEEVFLHRVGAVAAERT